MKDMLGRDKALSVEDALSLIHKNLPQRHPKEVKVPLEDSYGMVLSRDIVSSEDLPHFRRSAVDGFAVYSEDTFALHSYLSICSEIQMGEAAQFKLKRGEVVRISTGGMLPEGADAVLMLEHAQYIDDRMIEVMKAVAPEENVIEIGEDVKKGEILLQRGQRLRPQDVAVLAGVGIKEVFVYERLRVSIISTGDEIISHESPLMPGLVRDMNSFTLRGLIMEEGATPLNKGIFKDEYTIIRNVLEESLKDSELILITGGSSVGAKDMTARVINDMGRLLFHGVSMKPGKPTVFGIIGDTPVFGIPGHPSAVLICFDVFIRPLLLLMSGRKEEGFLGRNRLKARLTKSIHSGTGKREYFRVSLEMVDGEMLATPLLGKSGLIMTLVKADGVIEVLPHQLGVEKGEFVEVKLFEGK